jgi:hypothetical protein
VDLQLLATTTIEATFPKAYKTLSLLGASLPSSFLFLTSFFIAEHLIKERTHEVSSFAN